MAITVAATPAIYITVILSGIISSAAVITAPPIINLDISNKYLATSFGMLILSSLIGSR